jgi:hypothetical protein
MNLRQVFRRPAPPAEPLPAVRLAYAFACEECGWIVEQADNLRCKKCGSGAIFHVLSVLNATKNRARQRLKMAETIKAAQRRGETNMLAVLTAREPEDAA